jgi:hypothetical protein
LLIASCDLNNKIHAISAFVIRNKGRVKIGVENCVDRAIEVTGRAEQLERNFAVNLLDRVTMQLFYLINFVQQKQFLETDKLPDSVMLGAR